MYIVVNKYPIDVYKIHSITKVYSINANTYSSILKAYIGWKKKTEPSIKGTYHSVAEEHMNTHSSDYRFYNTFIKRLDDMLIAVTGKGVIKEKPTGIYDPWAPMNAESQEDFPRLLKPDEIDWNILPDTFFFGITYDLDDIFSGPRSTGSGKQLWSEFYDSEEDATKARDSLLSAINTVRYETIKLDI
jgi:hypothetical protein